MRFVVPACLCLLASSCGELKQGSGRATQPPAAAEPTADTVPAFSVWPDGVGLAEAIDESARSTDCPFVLVAWRNARSGVASRAAVPVGSLLNAIRHERGLPQAEAIAFATGGGARTMEFANELALHELARAYSENDLAEIRALLASASAQEIVAAQNSLDSALNLLSRQRHGTTYGYLRVALHILLERNVPCGAGCKPGLIYLREPRRGD